MTNSEITKALFEIAAYLAMEEVPFKPRAYERAAHSIEGLDQELKEIYKKEGINGLLKISGIGESIAKKIIDLIEKGKTKTLEDFRKKYPIELFDIIAIEGVGPKIAKQLYQKLRIKNIQDLEEAAKKGLIRKLEGFGEKSELKILKGIEFYKKTKGRFILGFEMSLIEDIRNKLKSLKEVKKIEICGSYARREETIGDIDILVVADNPVKVMDYFVKLPEVIYVYGKGPTKTNVRLKSGIDADLRIVKEDSWGSALQYFIGNKDHNIVLRTIAEKLGYKLNEYGLFKGKKKIAGKDEKEIYKKLGLQWIPPELRTNTGEIEAAQKNEIPDLIPYGSLKGDLQIQTNWTDGQESIEKNAEVAAIIGLEYIGITDHSKSLGVAGGLKEKELFKQWEEIEKINSKLENLNLKFKILKSCEVNILKDGRLDYDDEILKKMDYVLAGIHDNFNLSKSDQTKRLIKAMENPYVDIIAHPTGRIIQKRPGYELDLEEIFKVAAKTGTILEINAFPDRLDLKDTYVREAKRYGVLFTINSDAHHSSHFNFLDLGVSVARRGWCQKKDVLNTFSLEKFLMHLPKRKKLKKYNLIST